MITAYFVVSKSSGNIIRITQRESPPDDTLTVYNVPVSTSNQMRYDSLYANGEDLINLQSVTRPTRADTAKPQHSCRMD
ncbi:hypothetical protein NG726_25950 [Pseudomonas sp. MOB-449]|nr:hypothetical protein [Pseudomonas sp. MOB-449]